MLYPFLLFKWEMSVEKKTGFSPKGMYNCVSRVIQSYANGGNFENL